MFLHGLRGDIKETWTKEGVLWPQDLLAKDIPNSRIFLFGYDSSITQWNQNELQKKEIHSDADDLTARLATERSESKTVSTAGLVIFSCKAMHILKLHAAAGNYPGKTPSTISASG